MQYQGRNLIIVGILSTQLIYSGCTFPNASSNSNPSPTPSASPTPAPSPSPTPNLRVSFFSTLHLAGSNGNLVVDSHGSIFYPNPNGYVINKIDVNGNQTVFAGSGSNAYTDGTGTGASFYAPRLIAIDRSDNLYLADGFKVRKITSSGVVSTAASMVDGGNPSGIAADSSGNIYFVWNNSGNSTHTVKKITLGGSISTFAGSGTAGSLNGTGTSAEFNYPQDLVVDSNDNVFVADAGNYLIRKITPAGVVSTFAGSGSQSVQDGAGISASFSFYNYYAHMGIDSSNNIYVGDMTGISANRTNVIRKIAPTGVVTTFCGTANWTGSTGDCSAISAVSRFGVAVGPDGTVYFADTNNLLKISF